MIPLKSTAYDLFSVWHGECRKYRAWKQKKNRDRWWAMDTIDNQFIHDLIDAALGPGASEYEHRLMFNGAKLAWGIRELEQLPREMAMAKAREIGRGK